MDSSPMPFTFPSIERIVLSFSTRTDDAFHTQNIELPCSYLPGFNKKTAVKMMEKSWNLGQGESRRVYGGGVLFTSEGYIITHPFDLCEEMINYEYPITTGSNWGRLYTTTRNHVHFELQSGKVNKEVEVSLGVVVVTEGFSCERMFVQQEWKKGEHFFELEEARLQRDAIYQTLRVERIIRSSKSLK